MRWTSGELLNAKIEADKAVGHGAGADRRPSIEEIAGMSVRIEIYKSSAEPVREASSSGATCNHLLTRCVFCWSDVQSLAQFLLTECQAAS